MIPFVLFLVIINEFEKKRGIRVIKLQMASENGMLEDL